MTDREKLTDFAEQLIRQKRIIRSVKNLLLTSFIILCAGTVLSLPLRYFFGMSFILPMLITTAICLLSFIYGFLGIISREEVLKEADSRLALNEKLSAAYQFGNTENPYSRLIQEEGGIIAETVKAGDVYPLRFSRRDPFLPLLLALFFFLWMSSFSFLQIGDDQRILGEVLGETSSRIDAVNSGDEDKDLEDISDEYRKLGEKIQNRFMNEEAIQKEIEDLSRRLEKKIKDLSRQGVDKESKALGDDEAESEIYQLERKRDMSRELSDILDSLKKTFSITPDMQFGRTSQGEGGTEGEGSGSSESTDEVLTDEGSSEGDDSSAEGDSASSDAVSELDEGEDSETGESSDQPDSASGEEPDDLDLSEQDDMTGSEPSPGTSDAFDNDEFDSGNTPGNETPDDFSEMAPYKDKKQSGEFDEDENIRGELQEGEQMKSFIRALPHMVEPTKEEMDVIRFYRNQLETVVDREILPEGYESVIRDYFLGIGVLKDE